jgi:hypothetical protein
MMRAARGPTRVFAMEKPSPSPLVLFGAIAALFGACLAAWVAAISKNLVCESTCRDGLMTTQLIVAVLGLFPVGALLYAALRNRSRLALLSFGAGVVTYLAWGILNDAAVHGWHHMKVF